jgi:hypothetical protein
VICPIAVSAGVYAQECCAGGRIVFAGDDLKDDVAADRQDRYGLVGVVHQGQDVTDGYLAGREHGVKDVQWHV